MRLRLGALDLAGLHAAGADVGLADMAVLVANRDLLDIGLEPAVRHTVGMAHIAACRGLLPANLANLRHIINSIESHFTTVKTVSAKLALKL